MLKRPLLIAAVLVASVAFLAFYSLVTMVTDHLTSESPFLEHVRDWELRGTLPNTGTVRFSPKGDRFLVANEPGLSIDVFETASAKLISRLKIDKESDGGDRPFAYSPDDTRIAVGGETPSLQIWDAKTFALLHTVNKGPLAGDTDDDFTIQTLAWSPDSARMVVAAYGNDAVVVDAHSLKRVATLHGHFDMVNAAEYSPRGDLIVTVSSDATVRLWDTKDNSSLGLLPGHPDVVTCMAWSVTGDELATGGIATAEKRARVALCNVKTRTLIRNFEQAYNPEAVRFSRDGKRLETYDRYEMHVWDIETGRQLVKISFDKYAFGNAIRSPDRKHLIAVGDRDLGIWAQRAP